MTGSILPETFPGNRCLSPVFLQYFPETGVCHRFSCLRDIGKRLGLNFPLDGPKMLDGLLLEYLQEFADAPSCVRIGNCIMEVIEVQNGRMKVAKSIHL